MGQVSICIEVDAFIPSRQTSVEDVLEHSLKMQAWNRLGGLSKARACYSNIWSTGQRGVHQKQIR
jgi:hypothetical protein